MTPELQAKIDKARLLMAKPELLSPVVAAAEIVVAADDQPKICRTCLHLLGNRSNPADAESKWQCYHPKNRNVLPMDLITGERKVEYSYNLTSLRTEILRGTQLSRIEGEVCGKEGKWWELYVQPNYHAGTVGTTPAAKPLTKNKQANIGLGDI